MAAGGRPDRAGSSDRELVLSARAGDVEAFDTLFYRHRDGIYRAALAITHEQTVAEEIVVDAFARAYRAIDRLDPRDSLRPWLYRVALNLALNRRPRARPSLESLDDASETASTGEEALPETFAERNERQMVVLAAIDALSAKQRVVVILHYLHDMNLAEIAEIVGCPVGTVKSRLHYALRHLRVRLLADRRIDIEPIRGLAPKEIKE